MTRKENIWIAIAMLSLNIAILFGLGSRWEKQYNDNIGTLIVLTQRIELQTMLLVYHVHQSQSAINNGMID